MGVVARPAQEHFEQQVFVVSARTRTAFATVRPVAGIVERMHTARHTEVKTAFGMTQRPVDTGGVLSRSMLYADSSNRHMVLSVLMQS